VQTMSGFRAFIAKGNIIDLAVAVIIGAAFAKIVASLTEDVIMPIIGAIFGGLDFSNYFVLLKPVPATYHGPMSYAALKAAGVPMLGYGQFLTVAVNFVILAFIIYLMIKYAMRMMPKKDAAAPAGPAEDVLLLREIRDSLRAKV
jgi:large conductance mechanosensitive channel